MRKRIAIALLTLTLAAISTIAASWACAAWVTYEFDSVEVTTVEIGPYEWDNTFIQKRFGVTFINYLRGPVKPDPDHGTLAWHSTDRRATDLGQTYQTYSNELRAGWPFRALRCSHPDRFNLTVMGRYGVHLRQSNIATTIERGIELSPGASTIGWRALPYDPIWPGLISNIALHWLAWLVILLAPVVFVRWNRLRRRLCPKCAYPIGVSPRCTECGTALPTKVRELSSRAGSSQM